MKTHYLIYVRGGWRILRGPYTKLVANAMIRFNQKLVNKTYDSIILLEQTTVVKLKRGKQNGR